MESRIEYFAHLFQSTTLKSFNSAELLSLSTKFEKIETKFLESYGGDLHRIKIAILSSCTTYYFTKTLKLFTYAQGITPVLHEGGFGGIVYGLLDKDSPTYRFKPDVILLLNDHRDIKEFPKLFSHTHEIDAWVEKHANFYRSLWENVYEKETCQILHGLFAIPPERQLGNMECNYHFSKYSCLKLLHHEMLKEKPGNVTFVDMDYLASYFGKAKWFDEQAYIISKQSFSMEALGLVSHLFAKLVASHIGKAKKCLIVDLDNTLWGGIIGDDGLDGISLTPNEPLGEAFIAFQHYLKRLVERGVILAVCSKNEHDTAKQPFLCHPYMVLKYEDISCFVANWENKVDNIRKIAKTLNIGIDTMVFFDDNPAERALVKSHLPQVEVIDVPNNPAYYARSIDESMCFEWAQMTREDLSRTKSYITVNGFKKLTLPPDDYKKYLESLKMKAEVHIIKSAEIPRFTQLINKTNQFNLRTKRYLEAQIAKMANENENWALLSINFSDDFMNYGLISAIILKKITDFAFIDTWVMSCRVLNRGIENLAVNFMAKTAKKIWKCESIIGEYIPTKKNHLVETLFQEKGFEKATNEWSKKLPQEENLYRLDLSAFSPREHFITLRERPFYCEPNKT